VAEHYTILLVTSVEAWFEVVLQHATSLMEEFKAVLRYPKLHANQEGVGGFVCRSWLGWLAKVFAHETEVTTE
jgi:hypothetical protein